MFRLKGTNSAMSIPNAETEGLAGAGTIEARLERAERELRGFVLWRKTTLGSHSARGDEFAAALKSIIQTCRKQGRHVWNYLSAAVQAHIAGRSAPRLVTLAP